MGLYNTAELAVMAGCRCRSPSRAFYIFKACVKKGVDARDKPGHDVEGFSFRY